MRCAQIITTARSNFKNNSPDILRELHSLPFHARPTASSKRRTPFVLHQQLPNASWCDAVSNIKSFNEMIIAANSVVDSSTFIIAPRMALEVRTTTRKIREAAI